MAGGLDSALRSTERLPERTIAEFRQHLVDLDRFLEKLQNGGMLQLGVKLEVHDGAPSGPPQPGAANFRAVKAVGKWYLYLWNGTAWVRIELKV